MAESKDRSKRTKKKGNAKSDGATAEVTGSTGVGTSGAETTKKENAKTKRRARGNGAELLKKAADKLLVDHCEELLKTMLDNAKAGKMDSAKMLVSLSERKPNDVPVKKRKRRGLTGAQWLELQPEWTPPVEVGVDTGFGGHEPEA